MMPSEVAAVIGCITGVISFAGLIWVGGKRMGQIELKVDTLWDFQLRRGISEAVQKGAATVNSPVTITDEARKWMSSLAVELRAFYRTLGRTLSDRDLAIEIERRFGERLVKEVCIPRGIFEAACLVIAVHVAKEAT